MPNLATGNIRGEGTIDMVVATQDRIRYYYLNRCEPALGCSGRGSCEYSSFTHTSCKCVADLSAAGPQCESCSKGTIELPYKGGSDLRIAKPPECQECPSGYWSDIEEYTPDAICNPCQPGYYDNSSGGGTSISVCRSCPIGYIQPIQSLTFCEPCLPGKYQLDNGNITCIDCPSGYKQDKNGRKAKYANAPYTAPACQMCDPGRYQPANNGQPLCLECNPGMYGANHGMKKCDKCPKGTYRGSQDTKKIKCIACKAGQATNGVDGQPFCLLCDLGKFMNRTGAEQCVTCPPLTYQNNKGQLQCLGCTNKNIPNQDQTSCITPPWNTKESCNDDHYLNDSSKDNMDWMCVPCPDGSSCTGPISWSGVQSKFGWSRCSNTSLKFAACPFGFACLGAPNTFLENKFNALNGVDPATLNNNESCAEGYKNESFLCAACDDDYSHSSIGGRCDRCPPPAGNTSIAIFGVFGGVLGLFIYINLALSDKGKIDPADGAKSIGLSYIQIISLLATYPIAWPIIFVNIFKIGGAVAVLGQHLVNLKCAYPELTEADVFYMTRIAWAIIPVALPLTCVLVWYLIDKIKGVRNLHEKMKTSIVALLYLIWPGICSETFALFSCRNVCNQLLLRVDLEEVCGQGRHLVYSTWLGIPMLLFYVIGLPLIASIMVVRVHQRARDRGEKVETAKGHLTFGLFYSACKTIFVICLIFLIFLFD